jgi:hypothetical protein
MEGLMSKSRILTIAAVALALSLTAAAQGRGHGGWGRQDHDGWRGNDRGHARNVRDNDGDHDGRRDARQRNRRDHDGDRDDFFGGRGERSTPPGWSHGRKTGWGNCDVPPGQAKKSGCNNSSFGDYDRSGYYRRDHHRRPYNGPIAGTPPIHGSSNTARRLPPPYNQHPPRTSTTAKKRLPRPYDQDKR